MILMAGCLAGPSRGAYLLEQRPSRAFPARKHHAWRSRHHGPGVLAQAPSGVNGAPLRHAPPSAGQQSPPGANGSPAGEEGPAGSRQYWQELLSPPEPEMFGQRARSASDAAVLRRKGHLKEQDKFIEFLLKMHQTHTSLEVRRQRACGSGRAGGHAAAGGQAGVRQRVYACGLGMQAVAR